MTVKPDAKLLVRSPERSDSNLRCKVQAQLELDASAIGKEIKASGKFILATNVLETKQLNPDDTIVKYKEQQSTERLHGCFYHGEAGIRAFPLSDIQWKPIYSRLQGYRRQ